MEIKYQPHTPATFSPGREPLISIKQEAGWKLQRRETFLAPAEN
jgi:hypothetical protein